MGCQVQAMDEVYLFGYISVTVRRLVTTTDLDSMRV